MADTRFQYGPAFVFHRVVPFEGVNWIHEPVIGCIAWRRGSGDNVELLHVYSFSPGGGREMLQRLAWRLESTPPYYSVYGFTRVENVKAQEFYRRNGFTIQRVDGVYKDGAAILFMQPWDEMRRRFCK